MTPWSVNVLLVFQHYHHPKFFMKINPHVNRNAYIEQIFITVRFFCQNPNHFMLSTQGEQTNKIQVYFSFLGIPLVCEFIIFIFFIEMVYLAEKNIHFRHQGNSKPNKYKITFQYFQHTWTSTDLIFFVIILRNSNFPNLIHNIQRESRFTLSYFSFNLYNQQFFLSWKSEFCSFMDHRVHVVFNGIFYTSYLTKPFWTFDTQVKENWFAKFFAQKWNTIHFNTHEGIMINLW